MNSPAFLIVVCCLLSSLAEVEVITVITNMIVTSLSLMRNVQRKLFNLTHPYPSSDRSFVFIPGYEEGADD